MSTWKEKINAILKSVAIAIVKVILPNFWQRLEQQKIRFNDWAQLQIYHHHNLALGLPAVDENRIIFFGDSITEFWDLTNIFPNKNYINRGISGQTTSQMLIRLRPDVISLCPKIMIFLAGINDIAGNTGPMTLEMIEDNYASVCELAQMNSISIIFASVLPIHKSSPLSHLVPDAHDKIYTLNHWIQTYCENKHHIYLNYHSHMLDELGMLRTDLSDDGLHPNIKGYKMMAILVETAIQQAIQRL